MTLFALTACQQEARVSVVEDMGSVRIAARFASSERQPCIDSLTVYPATPDNAPPVWDIHGTPGGSNCTSQIDYGRAPAGFGEDRPSQSLQPGTRYRVMVAGVGFLGTRIFTYRGAGKPPSALAPP